MTLTRIRFQHLLADFQSIHPQQSGWADAQRLMTRWGKWGSYEGTCDSAACSYKIALDYPYSSFLESSKPEMSERIRRFHLIRAFEYLGWHRATFEVDIVVNNGIITGMESALMFVVQDFDNVRNAEATLYLRTQVRPRLNTYGPGRHSGWILGNDEQLADHPDYKVGRPTGCLDCQLVEVTYTPYLSHSEVVRLTSYNFGCINSFRACSNVSDILPASRKWHFYDDSSSVPEPVVKAPEQPQPCRTDVRALGRDAEAILEVEPLSTSRHKGTGVTYYIDFDLTRFRLLRTVKGPVKEAAGFEFNIYPFYGFPADGLNESAERLETGKRYFVLLDTAQLNYEHLEARRCGVLEDTPSVLQQLNLGIMQDKPEP